MNSSEFKQFVIKVLMEKGIADYDLYYSCEEDTTVEIFKNEVSHFSSSTNAGICLRCLVNGKPGSASTQLFTKETAVLLVSHALENAKSIESHDIVEIQKPAASYHEAASKAFPLASSNVLIEKALECQKLAYDENSKVSEGTQTFTSSIRTSIELTNSKGIELSHNFSMDMAYINTVIKDGEDLFSGDAFEVNPISSINYESLAKEAVEDGLSNINAKKISSGKHNAVISGRMMATLLQTFFPVFSAESVQQGLSLLRDKKDTQIASSCLTLIDDPFYSDSFQAGSHIQMPFDAEGSATYTKYIVENGILKTLLYDGKSAKKENISSTGNGIKENYASPIHIMPYTFYVKPGEISLDSLLKQLENGIYITNIQGLHAGADPITGDFSLAAGGFLVVSGKKSQSIKEFTISGNFYTLLKQILALGDDIKFGPPKGCSCFGSPSVLVQNISVAGE
ncbi:MAG: TldD/PmbA family protein [Acetivibrio sp.]